LIIGVVGFAGSGKGTVSDLLVANYGYKKMAFADPVKDATAVIFGWDRSLLEGDTDESRAFRETPDKFWSERFGFAVTPRWALQKMGTEGGRDTFHDSLWVTALERRIDCDNIVVSDVRFPNEIKKIKSLGGYVVRVIRGDEPEWYDTAYKQNTLVDQKNLMTEKYPNIHISEWAWIGSSMDFVLYNNGSKSELEANVSYMLKVFRGPTVIQNVA
jgi:hypothetical protein